MNDATTHSIQRILRQAPQHGPPLALAVQDAIVVVRDGVAGVRRAAGQPLGADQVGLGDVGGVERHGADAAPRRQRARVLAQPDHHRARLQRPLHEHGRRRLPVRRRVQGPPRRRGPLLPAGAAKDRTARQCRGRRYGRLVLRQEWHRCLEARAAGHVDPGWDGRGVSRAGAEK